MEFISLYYIIMVVISLLSGKSSLKFQNETNTEERLLEKRQYSHGKRYNSISLTKTAALFTGQK